MKTLKYNQEEIIFKKLMPKVSINHILYVDTFFCNGIFNKKEKILENDFSLYYYLEEKKKKESNNNNFKKEIMLLDSFLELSKKIQYIPYDTVDIKNIGKTNNNFVNFYTDEKLFKEYLENFKKILELEKLFEEKYENEKINKIILIIDGYEKISSFTEIVDKKEIKKNLKNSISKYNFVDQFLLPNQILNILGKQKYFTKQFNKSLLSDISKFQFIEQEVVNLEIDNNFNSVYFILEEVKNMPFKYGFVSYSGFISNPMRKYKQNIQDATPFIDLNLAKEYLNTGYNSSLLLKFNFISKEFSIIDEKLNPDSNIKNDVTSFIEKIKITNLFEDSNIDINKKTINKKNKI